MLCLFVVIVVVFHIENKYKTPMFIVHYDTYLCAVTSDAGGTAFIIYPSRDCRLPHLCLPCREEDLPSVAVPQDSQNHDFCVQALAPTTYVMEQLLGQLFIHETCTSQDYLVQIHFYNNFLAPSPEMKLIGNKIFSDTFFFKSV